VGQGREKSRGGIEDGGESKKWWRGEAGVSTGMVKDRLL